MEFEIDDRKIGPGHPAFIVAELSCNHLQDFDLAVRTLHAMKKSGADAVKLQTYTPDTITLDSDAEDFQIKQGTIWDGQTLHTLYQKAYTPWDWIPKIKKEAKTLGMSCFSSVFDKTSTDFLEKLIVPAYKVASFEITDIPLIKYTATKGKPMIFATGIAELSDLEKAVKACRSAGNNQIAILKCTSAYPTPFEEANLNTIPDIARKFNTIVGLSDHTSGIVAPVAATALGANIIEKHYILDRNLKDKNGEYSPDRPFSLEPEEFKNMVQAVRNTEAALGKVNYSLTEKTKRNREFARSLYISQDIKAGNLFTENNVRSVRPGFGLHPENLEKVLGKRASIDLKKGTRMSWDLVG